MYTQWYQIFRNGSKVIKKDETINKNQLGPSVQVQKCTSTERLYTLDLSNQKYNSHSQYKKKESNNQWMPRAHNNPIATTMRDLNSLRVARTS